MSSPLDADYRTFTTDIEYTEIVLQEKLTTIFKNEYRETNDKERTGMKVTVSGVSNMLENISSAIKKHKK